MNAYLSFENSDRLQRMLNDKFEGLGAQEWSRFLAANGIHIRSPGTHAANYLCGFSWGEIRSGLVTVADPSNQRWLNVPEEFAMKALTLGIIP